MAGRDSGSFRCGGHEALATDVAIVRGQGTMILSAVQDMSERLRRIEERQYADQGRLGQHSGSWELLLRIVPVFIALAGVVVAGVAVMTR